MRDGGVRLVAGGVPVHDVAARLGHANPSITLRVHAHVISDQLAEAADIFARAIVSAGQPKGPFHHREGPVSWARSEGLEPPTFWPEN